MQKLIGWVGEAWMGWMVDGGGERNLIMQH